MDVPGTDGRMPATRNTVTGALNIRAKMWLVKATSRLDKKAAAITEPDEACTKR